MNPQEKDVKDFERKETAATDREDDTTSCADLEVPTSESCKLDVLSPLTESTKQRLGQFVVACIVVNYISAGYILLPGGKSKGA